ncbi:UNVERIFIED_CONTAM: hypothetical protein FKN15_024687 [Acipenser sinensis]
MPSLIAPASRDAAPRLTAALCFLRRIRFALEAGIDWTGFLLKLCLPNAGAGYPLETRRTGPDWLHLHEMDTSLTGTDAAEIRTVNWTGSSFLLNTNTLPPRICTLSSSCPPLILRRDMNGSL